MKKYVVLLMVSISSQILFAQTSYEELSHCWRSSEQMQNLIRPQLEGFHQLQKTIYARVQTLIRTEEITQVGGVPYFENLASVTRAAQELATLDSIYEAYFMKAVLLIDTDCREQRICVAKLPEEQYRDYFVSYLEDEVFEITDDYASVIFAKSLGFRSALQMVNEQVEAWLLQDNPDLAGEDPSFSQRLTQDHFWSVLNDNWDIELRNPERELLQAPLLTYARQDFFGEGVAAKEKTKVKDVLLFIFDNWKEIKDILNWLNENVFYDCAASTSARFRGVENIDATISSGVRKKANYLVLQRGVLFDGRQTKTSLKGVVRLYKKKRIGWGRDRTTTVGIGYCTTQTNACENSPWPADGSIYVQAPTLRNFKVAQHQLHPYALAIRDHGAQYLTYYLYYKDNLFKTIYLLGSGNCM
jgi:hypothetical protein